MSRRRKKSSPGALLAFGIFFIVVVVMMDIMTMKSFNHNEDDIIEAVIVSDECIDWEVSKSSSSKSVTYNHEVEITYDYKGDTYTTTTKMKSSKEELDINEKVYITVDENDPEYVRSISNTKNIGEIMIMPNIIMIGTALIFIGIGLSGVIKKKKSKAENIYNI